MAIEIVDFPIKNGDYPLHSIAMSVHQRVYQRKADEHGDKPDKPNWSCVIHARLKNPRTIFGHTNKG